MYELHDFHRSSAAYRVRIALALKDIGYQQRPVDLLAGEQHDMEFRSLNPQGLVPVYGDENLHLTQSLAILEYLEERYPTPPLLPTGHEARARARQIANLICCDMHPLNGFRVLVYMRDALRAGTAARRAWFQHWMLEGLDALELWLTAEQSTGRYCVGDEVTMADICLVPQVDLARRNGIDLGEFPRIAAVDSACMSLPAFKDTHPDRAGPKTGK